VRNSIFALQEVIVGGTFLVIFQVLPLLGACCVERWRAHDCADDPYAAREHPRDADPVYGPRVLSDELAQPAPQQQHQTGASQHA
jgi:hypothetical protein